MNVVDCDAHVEESVETWSYLDPEFYLLRPLPVLFSKIPVSVLTMQRG